MNVMIRKLPYSGVQDFAKIRNDYDVYVDKTAYIHSLISNYNTVFLSRPRRLALKQIEEKKYYIPYLKNGLNIYKIGVVFGEKERNIIEWQFNKVNELN